MGVTGNHSHFITLSSHPIDVKWSLKFKNSFQISGTLEVQNQTHGMKVLGNKVGVASCSTPLITSCD